MQHFWLTHLCMIAYFDIYFLVVLAVCKIIEYFLLLNKTNNLRWSIKCELIIIYFPSTYCVISPVHDVMCVCECV